MLTEQEHLQRIAKWARQYLPENNVWRRAIKLQMAALADELLKAETDDDRLQIVMRIKQIARYRCYLFNACVTYIRWHNRQQMKKAVEDEEKKQ